MRLAVRGVAVLAALSFSATLAFIAGFARGGGAAALVSRGAFGVATIIGWAIALTAGPLAAVELWRFRERGRIAGLILFGWGVLYYAAGMVAWRSSAAPLTPILVALAVHAVPFVLLLGLAGWFRHPALRRPPAASPGD
jgi:hypothetical protein